MFKTTSVVAAVKYAIESGVSEIEMHHRIQLVLKTNKELPDIFYNEVNQWQRYMAQNTRINKLQEI